MEFQDFKMKTRKDVKIIEKLLSRVSDSYIKLTWGLLFQGIFKEFLWSCSHFLQPLCGTMPQTHLWVQPLFR